jgi:hypothetical protein
VAKMLGFKNLINELTILYISDERVIDLQEEILEEFLQDFD